MTTVLEDRAVRAREINRADTTRRIRAEFHEMPGLTLTVPQAARLWSLSLAQSERLLSELVDRGFLVRDPHGAYRREGCPRCS
jgi:Fic family protein